MPISVVIPTCDRKQRLLALLNDLNQSTCPLLEVIIVDSGSDRLVPSDYAGYEHLPIIYTGSEKSVCIQRNTGIRMASAPWIFLCDDDIEVPPDYLQKLVDHTTARQETGALSGLFLQKENNSWTAQYPLRSARLLVWKFIFQQSIWGEIDVPGSHPLINRIKEYYRKKGNHISKAGWPVLTRFSGDSFTTPLYSLGAALVKKEWLLSSPFDEVLDRHGMGDNYGVTTSLPGEGVTVLTDAFVYHHKEADNRLKRPLQYFRRVLALDYFISTRKNGRPIRKSWLLWSLTGNLLSFIRDKDRMMMKPAIRTILLIAAGRNPYRKAAKAGQKVLEPELPAKARPLPKTKVSPRNTPLLWTVFIFYILLLAYAGMHHELWGDEVHSWNIAKGSGSYSDLLANRRYEGHPPAWYTLLWLISSFTHQVRYMQWAQELIAVAIAWIILFKAPFALPARILLPFGYYFLFEYGVFSRNYALGVLFACCICLVIRKDFRYKPILYYLLLFCLSNVHLLTLLLAGSIHLYFLLFIREQQQRLRSLQEKPVYWKSPVLIHALLGLLVLLPAACFIHVPSDSEVNLSAWTHTWTIRQLGSFYQPVLRAFLPVPAWWEYHFWNTQFLLEAGNRYPLLRLLNPLMAIALLGSCFFLLRKNNKCSALFAINLLLSYILSVTAFSLTTARHAGFLYIGFIIAWWLYNEENSVAANNRRLINALLIVQGIAGLFAVFQDIRLPFSNTDKVNGLISEVPAGRKLVTDYWTMNAVVAYTDQPIYCVDVQQELSFVLFDNRLSQVDGNPHRYTDGLAKLFQKSNLPELYWISLSSPQLLTKTDPLLGVRYHLTLMDKKEGAIEKGSNLYLYRVEPL
ncbi:MAG TPA: glycosyltransferase family 2 protein [Puia sp.]